MPFAAYPLPPPDPALGAVAGTLDPVLKPLGFGPGSVGASESCAQVTFCGGDAHSDDGACVDLVVELEPLPEWHVTDVRYWGFPSDRWHLAFPRDAELATQLADLAHSLPDQLALR